MKDEQKPKRHIAEQFNFVFDEPKVDLSIEAVQKRREEAQREAVRKASEWLFEETFWHSIITWYSITTMKYDPASDRKTDTIPILMFNLIPLVAMGLIVWAIVSK